MTPAQERRFLDLVNSAVRFQKQGDLAGAVQNYEKAVAIYADHPVVLSNLGNALRALGKAGEAVSLQRRAVAIDPANSWFLLNLYEAERDAHVAVKPTLRRIMECPTTKIPTRMWAAIALGEPEKAFAFKPEGLNVMPWADMCALYRPPALKGSIAALPRLEGTHPPVGTRPLLFAAMDGAYAAIFCAKSHRLCPRYLSGL